jgi:cytoskeletal protein RodZ
MKGNVPMTATASPTQSEFFVDKATDNPARPRPASRGFARYMLAICVGVGATLTWQSYSQATKQIIATRAPDLGWSPEAKQTIASWVEQLSWTNPPAGAEIATAPPSVPETAQAATVAQTAPYASKASASLDPQQVQQLALDVAAVRQSVEQVAASQTKMAAEINNLLETDMEIFLKIPTSPQPPAALSHKPIPAAPPSRAPNRRTDVTPNHSLADSFRN